MNSTMAFITVLLGILAATVLLGIRQRSRDAAALETALREQYGHRPVRPVPADRLQRLRALSEEYRSQEYDASGDLREIDEITWNDLEADRLFADLDTCRSDAGEWFLYRLLRRPALSGAQQAFAEEDIAVWEEHPELRLEVQKALSRAGHDGTFDAVQAERMLLEGGEISLPAQIAALALPFAALAVMCVHTQAGLLMLLAVLAYNIVSYFRARSAIGEPLGMIQTMLRLAAAADRIPDLRGTPHEAGRAAMAASAGKISGTLRGSRLLLREAGDPLRAPLDYLCMLLHPDLIVYALIRKQAGGLVEETRALYRETGRLDASIAVASWRRTLSVWCEPVLTEEPAAERGAAAAEQPVYAVKGLIHPLLEAPVGNDLETSRPILVTGSNASGKSTFLKAAAYAALLAQTVRTVPASEYAAPPLRVCTSMALRDSLQEGESYYIVEIRSLKRILDAAEAGSGQPRILCCIDEVLRGTGTVERIAASSEILLELARRGVLCMAATHDGELTSLLDGTYDNYHFGEQFDGGDVRFTYRIEKGPSRSQNAIRLLGELSYDRGIVERARKRADTFLKEGIWR